MSRAVHTLVGVQGRVQSVRQARIGFTVADVEEVSGGTIYSLTEISDPVVLIYGEGVDFLVRFDVLKGNDEIRLRLAGAQASVVEKRKVTAKYPSVPPASGPSVEVALKQSGAPAPQPPPAPPPEPR